MHLLLVGKAYLSHSRGWILLSYLLLCMSGEHGYITKLWPGYPKFSIREAFSEFSFLWRAVPKSCETYEKPSNGRGPVKRYPLTDHEGTIFKSERHWRQRNGSDLTVLPLHTLTCFSSGFFLSPPQGHFASSLPPVFLQQCVHLSVFSFLHRCDCTNQFLRTSSQSGITSSQ